jgi:hypothetical protein
MRKNSQIFADNRVSISTGGREMDIATLSMNMAQNNVQDQAAMSVQKMSLDNMDQIGQDLAVLMQSAAIITDPNVGNTVDFYA